MLDSNTEFKFEYSKITLLGKTYILSPDFDVREIKKDILSKNVDVSMYERVLELIYKYK